MWRRIFASFNRAGLGPNIIGLAAIDVAVWGYHARRQNVPLAIAMGASHGGIEVYGSGGFTATQSAGQAADMAAAHVESGFRLIKPPVKSAASDTALHGLVLSDKYVGH